MAIWSRVLLVHLALLGAQLGGPPNTPAPSQSADGLIVGRVVDGDSDQPVAGAIVSMAVIGREGTLASLGFGSERLARFLTDGDGRFAFNRLGPGRYAFAATKNGYISGAYGRLRPSSTSGRSVPINDRVRAASIVIRMFKYASLSGTLVDEAGEPVVNTTVRAYRRSLVAGRRVFGTDSGSAQTDDRGMYRIGQLVPGDYVVAVPVVQSSVPAGFEMNGPTEQNLQSTLYPPGGFGGGSIGIGERQVTADGRFLLQATGTGHSSSFVEVRDGRAYSYPTQYYPGVATAAEAMPIALASGQQRSGLDLVLRPVPTATISGQLLAPTGPAATYALHLTLASGTETLVGPDVGQAVTAPDGTFMFLAVPPGQYVIQTTRVPRNNAAGGPQGNMASPDSQVLWVSHPVSVDGSDVRGLSLQLQPGVVISGRLEFDGVAERPNAARLAQIPVAVESASRAPINTPPIRVDAAGRFTSQGLLPGKYLVRIGGAPSGWALRSVILNGVDVSDTPIEVTKDLDNAVVTFTDRLSQLTGTVRVPSGSPEDTGVLIFPAESDRWIDFGTNPRRLRLVRPQASGAFTTGTLPAGDYFLVAVRDELTTDWMDPAVLGALSRMATRVTIGEGDRRTVDLTLQEVRLSGGFEDQDEPERDHGPAALPDVIDVAVVPVVVAVPVDQARDVRADPVGTGSISGIVTLDDAPKTPLRRVRVTVTSRDMRLPRIVTTDDAGRFTVDGLAPGRYVLMGTKPAYLEAVYGAARPGVSGTASMVALSAGQQVRDVALRMAKGGVITGTVFDDAGQPAVSAHVSVERYVMNNGERSLSRTGQYSTDDRGVYRVFGLPPGRYVVSVIPPASMGDAELRRLTDGEMRAALAEVDRRSTAVAAAPTTGIPRALGQPVGYAPTFHPSALTEDDATVLTLGPGQELSGIDVVARLSRTARIEGTVSGLDEQQLRNVKVQLGVFTPNSSSATGVQMTPTGFTFRNVSPGRYTLSATLSETVGPKNANGELTVTTRAAMQELNVSGDDITGLVLTLTDGGTVSGRVIFDGQPTPDPSLVRVIFEPLNNRYRAVPPPRGGPLESNGRFVLRGAMPGRYRLSVSAPTQGPSSAWTVRSVMLNGREMADQPIEIQSGQSLDGLAVIVTNQSIELSGAILDGAGGGVPGMMLALFSADRALWGISPRRLKMQRSDDDGRFRFQSLLPGDYFFAALTDFDQSEWGDPAFLEQLAAGAIRLSFKPGDKKVQDVQIR